MDRVSAILILGIMTLVMISSYIVFDTWLQSPGYDEEILVFNNDTSVMNNTDEALWLRAKVSEESKVAVTSIKINDDSWIDGEDGWHYYIECLEADNCTAPFVRSDKPSADAKAAVAETFKVKVEAVEQGKLSRNPVDGREAFLLLKRESQKVEPLFL